ncbi:MAG: hypothetical protein KG029_04685 [Bacteroidetes bacterium]|nr:hypothetical protein [Bacteroidota bacterium]
MKILISVPDHHGSELLEAVLRMKEFEKHVVVIDDKPPVKEVLDEITELKMVITPRPEIEYPSIGVSNEHDMRKKERQEWKYRQKHYQHRK